MKKKKDKETEKKTEHEEIINQNEEKNIAEQEAEQKNNDTQEDNDKSKSEVDYQKKFDDINDKYLRLYSDFDNFRKRTNKEKLELRKVASADVVTALLPVVDDFERAIMSMAEAKDVESVKEGVQLVFNKLRTILNQQGVEEMQTIGEKFDADIHDAITNIPAESEDKKGTIVDQTQKGYTMNGKVIRFPKVVVAN